MKRTSKPTLEKGDERPGVVLGVLRKHLNMSCATIGEKIGVSGTQVAKYENGVNRMSPSRIIKASDFFGVSESAFFLDLNVPHNEREKLLDRIVFDHELNKLVNKLSEQQRLRLVNIGHIL